MKRKVLIFVAAILALALLAVSAMAAGTQSNFVDTDQNGICDNRDTASTCVNKNDAGLCENRKTAPLEKPRNLPVHTPGDCYVDADEDGICDNLEDNGPQNAPSYCDGSKNRGSEGRQGGNHGKRHRNGQ